LARRERLRDERCDGGRAQPVRERGVVLRRDPAGHRAGHAQWTGAAGAPELRGRVVDLPDADLCRSPESAARDHLRDRRRAGAAHRPDGHDHPRRAAVRGSETDLRTSPTWDELAATGDYLTVMDYEFDDPARQVISDFTFASAPDVADHQEVVVQTRMRMIAGLPAGPVLLVLGVVGLVVGFV